MNETSNNSLRITPNIISLSLTIVALLLWFFAPFMAINILTLENQPTALELLRDDVTYIGDLVKTDTYKIAIAAIIGICICMLGIILKSKIGTRIVAGLTLLPLLKGFLNAIQITDNFEDFCMFFGISYWGICVILIIVLILGGKSQKEN